MTVDGRLSRRDFLRLRTTERGRLLEVSCRALFMRCADAAIVHEDVVEWEPWMGEPPPVIHRRSTDDLLEAFEQDLRDARVLRLLDAEWLDRIEGAPRIEAAISAFRARGGVVETLCLRELRRRPPHEVDVPEVAGASVRVNHKAEDVRTGTNRNARDED